jgi:hypothetical protein
MSKLDNLPVITEMLHNLSGSEHVTEVAEQVKVGQCER